MIFYFSGTGNSKWVAEEIAKQVKDEAVNIVDVKDEVYSFSEEQRVGLVFPVYAWNPPQIVIEFVKKIKNDGAFTFGICTCGENAGHIMKELSKIIPLNSTYSITMPNNYVIGMSVDSEEEAKSKITNAKARLNTICNEIKDGVCKSEITKGAFPYIKTSMGGVFLRYLVNKTKPFYAKESCNSCGLCEKSCPLKSITLING